MFQPTLDANSVKAVLHLVASSNTQNGVVETKEINVNASVDGTGATTCWKTR